MFLQLLKVVKDSFKTVTCFEVDSVCCSSLVRFACNVDIQGACVRVCTMTRAGPSMLYTIKLINAVCDGISHCLLIKITHLDV